MIIAVGLAVLVLGIVLAGGGSAWFFFVRAQDPERRGSHKQNSDKDL